MALSAGYTPARRGAPPLSGVYGGLVAAGEQIWRGGMICWNAAGTLQRLQTSGSVAFAGMASKDYNNTASAVAACSPPMEALKGTYALPVSGATYANIRQPVYGSDDNTFTLSNTQAAVFALGGSDTGTGVPSSIAVSAGAKVGVYTGTVLSGAATFSLTDPNGDALAAGTIGSAYSSGGVAFTLPNVSGHNFIAGDTFIITVSEAPGAIQVGTLDGIENGQTYVKLLGS